MRKRRVQQRDDGQIHLKLSMETWERLKRYMAGDPDRKRPATSASRAADTLITSALDELDREEFDREEAGARG